MATSVYVGGTVVVTAAFLTATGTVATVNNVIWSSTPPEGGGGAVGIAPSAPPSLTATITGVYPGLVTVIATPDTNLSVVANIDVNVIDPSGVPVSGTIS